MAWLGIAGSLGASRWLALACLSVAAIVVFIQAARMGNRYSILLGVLGAGMMFAGRFEMNSPTLVYSGLGMMVLASVRGQFFSTLFRHS